MNNALCNTFFAGKSLASSSLVFFGALDVLKREQRFPDAVIEAFQDNLLHHTRCTLFPSQSTFAKTEPMINAMHSVVCQKLDRFVPETWLVGLRNRSLPSISIMAQVVVEDESSPETLNSAMCLIRRQFFKTMVTGILNAAKRNPVNLKKMRNAIEHDIYESNGECPIVGTQRTVSVTNSNLVRVLFTPRNYKSMINLLTRVAASFNINDLDKLITPGAFSAFLAYIYEHVTRAPISDSQRKVEDFMGACFTLPSEKGAPRILSDAFFDGTIEAEGSIKTALGVVAGAAPFKDCIESLEKSEKNGHVGIPRFSKAHLYSPPVTHCATCGVRFLSAKAVTAIQGARSHKEMLAFAGEYVKEMKARRAQHFAEAYGTEPDSLVPTTRSASSNLHDTVRRVCCQPEFASLTVPNRQLILAVMDYLVGRNNPGCIYTPTIFHEVVLCTSDYLRQRAALRAAGHEPMVYDDILPVRERIVLEVEANDFTGVSLVEETGLDPQTQAALEEPIPFELASNLVVQIQHDDDDDDDRIDNNPR